MPAPRQIVRWEKGSSAVRARDELAGEEPLEIRIDDQPVSVTMRTPGHDAELAAGFLLAEGLVYDPGQVLKISHHPRNKEGNVIGVYLSAETNVDLERLRRNVFVSSSCGLCGKASIDEVKRHFPAIKSKASVDAGVLLRLPGLLRARQEAFDRTGGLHAAALFDLTGNLLCAREDIGRHNAVDKVLGRACLDGLLPLDGHILFVSGRVSFEIVQKALAARIPIIAAVSAPSSLAVHFAQSSGQTLAGFVRGNRLNVYSHPKRIKFK